MQGFVGREKEIAILSSMLDGEYRIANVTGIGGVGKSTLVEHFGELARDRGYGLGFVNARQLSVDAHEGEHLPAIVETLIALERNLRQHGCDLKSLRNRLDRYRTLHQQLMRKFAGEADATAVGAILQVGVSAIRAGSVVFPVAKPLNAVLTPELATKVGNAIASYRRAADRRILAQPAEELSTLLVDSLNDQLLINFRRILLIFDEFELLPAEVEQWLRRVFSNTYGALDEDIRLVMAGRYEVGQDWIGRGQALGVIRQIPLAMFTAEEMVQYIQFSDPAVSSAQANQIATTLDATYALPLALRLLVADSGYSADAAMGRLRRLNEELVSRLLDDEYTSPGQRKVALAAAVARRFDRALIDAIVDDDDQESSEQRMQWLVRQHFINPRAPSYTYFDLVRDIFCNYLQSSDPRQLEDLHRRLAAHYAKALEHGAHGQRIRSTAVELGYHRLWSADDNLLAAAMDQLIRYLPAAYEYALLWSRMLTQFLAERRDLENRDRRQLGRLASVLEESWRRSVPPGHKTSDRVADPALNVLFTSSFEETLPEINPSNAELWLSYFECRLDIVTGSKSQIDSALDELMRVWRATEELLDSGPDASLLAFRVASDVADVHTRRGDLSKALEYSRRAIEIAHQDNAPIRQAFGLYQLSNNLKRLGEYQPALEHLSEAIGLVRQVSSQAKSFYLGRFYLDRAVTLTYVSDTVAAESAFEQSRTYFADISPVSYAELSHRLGWLKRIRGDLAGALTDHEAAIRVFRQIETDLGLPSEVPTHVSFPLAKAIHSLANVYADMCLHEQATEHYATALALFSRQGGTRHEAIVRKDSGWSFFLREGMDVAEEQLIRALTDLGSQSSRSERPAVNSRTHIAEGWLLLSLIRSLSRRFEEALDAADQAEDAMGAGNPPLTRRLQIQRALIHALQGDGETIITGLMAVIAEAEEQDPPHLPSVATAHLVRAAIARSSGHQAAERAALAVARQTGKRWNEYLPTTLDQLWQQVAAAVDAVRAGKHVTGTGEISHDPVEIVDVYDESGDFLGRASIRLVHQIGLWHRAFHCWVVGTRPDGTGNFVIFQRRGPFSRSFPDMFDMSAAGHYRAGEGIEGGIRECNEELGIDVQPSELQHIANRVINESLSNGMVNREFQDIYLLRRSSAARDYIPGFPEVSAVIECDLDAVIDLLDGVRDDVPFAGVEGNQGGAPTELRGALSLGDLIAEARAYHQRVFRLIRDLIGNPRPSAEAIMGAVSGSEQLADGSRWVPLV